MGFFGEMTNICTTYVDVGYDMTRITQNCAIQMMGFSHAIFTAKIINNKYYTH